MAIDDDIFARESAPLTKGKFHDLVDFTKRYKAELHEFFMDVSSWKTFKPPVVLNWTRIAFGEATRSQVPTVRGLYVFTVVAPGIGLPDHGYILYVGETGNTGGATLRSRYGQYLANLKNQDGRPAVFYMMDNWKSDLFFNFVAVPDVAVDVKLIQNSFINALMPPVNKRDIDGKLAAGKAAVF